MQLLPLRLRNDLYCVEWGVKLYSLTQLLPCQPAPTVADFFVKRICGIGAHTKM